ncbi:MAG: hypothetical protein ACJA1U_002414 [Bermanella sp.]|jgi:hypothetical protein
MKCWASKVSPCDKIQSREHYVSKGLFSGNIVKVTGFPFLNGEEKEIGIERLVTKSLCQTHNSMLSEYDQEAINFANALKYANDLSLIRSKSSARKFSVHRKKINADRFSRWILKTYIGLSEFHSEKPKIPVERLSELVFSKNKILRHVHYRISLKKGDEFQTAETVEVAPLLFHDKAVGMVVKIYGVELSALFLEEADNYTSLPKIKFNEHKQGLSFVIEFI